MTVMPDSLSIVADGLSTKFYNLKREKLEEAKTIHALQKFT